MKAAILLCWLCIVSFTKSLAQPTIVSFQKTSLSPLAGLPDSSFHKIVNSVSFYLVQKQDKTKVKEVDVTKNLGELFFLPDSISKKYDITNLVVNFQTYLYEYFNLRMKESELTGFDSTELNTIRWLKSKRLDTVNYGWFSAGTRALEYLSTARFEYFHSKDYKVHNYSFTKYTLIPCTISYSPAISDVIVVTADEWIHKFGLLYPPAPSQVTKSKIESLFRRKISKPDNPQVLQLTEEAYVIIYVRNGKLYFDHIEPSPENLTKNKINL